MADARPLEDAFDRRNRETMKAQGVSELDYTQLLEEAVLHAAAAPAFPGAPSWRFVGPRNVGGRVIGLSQDPNDPRIIYAGSAHGGLWRSIDAGDTWDRLGDAQHVFPVGTIAVAPTATNTIYFGTGALDPTYVSGRGLFRATIAGVTGAATIERLAVPDAPTVPPVNATPGASLRYTRIRVDPDDPTRFWAASQSGLWRCDCPLAQPAVPHFTRDFPDRDNKPEIAKLVTNLDSRGLWPAHCTDVLVAHDPRETDTVPLNGVDVPRYLILYVAVDSIGIFRGRFDRKDASIRFDSDKLDLPMGLIDFTRIRLAQCERHPEHVSAIMAVNRPAIGAPPGSLLKPAVSGGVPIPLQYHATNATDGSSPGFLSLLRVGDQVALNDSVNAVENQTVTAVLSDTDFTVAAAYVTPFTAAGTFYFRVKAPDHNNSTEVFQSSDNGKSWVKGSTRIASVGALVGQADYDLVLEIAPDDPRNVIVGEGDICISHDSGNTFTKILDWQAYDKGDKAQHADQHIAMFDRGDHRRIWIGNDGGISLARDLRLPAQSVGYWRKRSHGIYAGMCQDVSVNPGFPFMTGVGFQDNGTFMSLGGPTWFHVGGGDGGAVAFIPNTPRQFYATWQGDRQTGDAIELVTAVASDAPGFNYHLVTVAASDVPETIARGHIVRYRWSQFGLKASGIAAAPPFVGVIEQHPTAVGQLLAGRKGDAYATLNFGTLWTPLMPGAPIGSEVPALAFGPVDPLNSTPGAVDGWAGDVNGFLYSTTTAPAAGWSNLASFLPFPGIGMRVSEIMVHPLDRRIIAVSVTGLQGRVFLSYDRGINWIDLTEPTPTALAVTPGAASLGLGQKLDFKAMATYPGGGPPVDVTARSAWTVDNPALATISDAQLNTNRSINGFGTEGRVTAIAAGTPNITATLIANVAAATASVPLIVTAGAQPVVPPVTPPRTIIPGSLPPGPASSVIFDPRVAVANPATLFVGTLVGVYALPNIPVVRTLAVQPAGPIVFQTGAAVFQLRCVATLTDGTPINSTASVDWSTDTPAVANVSNAAGTEGQITIGVVGTALISANRGGVPAGTLRINVQAAAAPLPVLPAAPAAVNPPITIAWQRFNTGLPQVLVTDFDRMPGTTAIRAGTFGLGVFECDTTGGPLQRTYIRQTVIEEARTNSRTPFAAPDDPRFPAGVVALDLTHAYDIRVDAPPYSFFDDVVDGVELDEQLEVGDPVPSEDNYVYVQVHNRGTQPIGLVKVHLYFAECAPVVAGVGDVINPIGAVATASPASLDAGAPISDFYGQPNRDPIAASKWKRIDAVRVIDSVPSDAPKVVRFTWNPPVTLAGKDVALLALCDPPLASADSLPIAPAGATLSTLIINERRAALRVVHVAARQPASVFVRDGASDDTRLGGFPVGGRSPDIMVARPDIAVAPDVAFKDPLARRRADTLSATGTNFIYVRVHNRRRFETKVNVKVFAIAMDDANAPITDRTKWTELPSAAAFANVTVAASGVGYAQVQFPTAPDPNPTGTNKVYLLLALIQAEDLSDRLPNKDRVDSADAFWELVSKFVGSDNAAARAITWVP